MATLVSEQLTVGYEQRIVVDQLSVSLPMRKITSIVGGNGSGKSTILKAFSRILTPYGGSVVLDGRSIHDMPSRQLAQWLSILPQQATAPESLTVRELVSYGRYPHRRWFRSLDRQDLEQIDWALEVVGLTTLQDSPVNALSGGQQQRVWIAMTLAQGTEILLLDEPTSHLDMCHQLEIMELLSQLNREQHKTVVMVLHDLNLAARYSQYMIVICEGSVFREGSPAEVMTADMLRDAFGVEARITSDPHYGTPLCIPVRSAIPKERAPM